jgi:hypothetical protein
MRMECKYESDRIKGFGLVAMRPDCENMCSFRAWLGFVLVIVMAKIPSGVSDFEVKNTAKFKSTLKSRITCKVSISQKDQGQMELLKLHERLGHLGLTCQFERLSGNCDTQT